MKVVLFDFDDTLTTSDTTLAFADVLVPDDAWRRRLQFLPALWAARARMLTNTTLKRRFARLFLRGKSTARVRDAMHEFYASQLESITDQDVLARMRSHLAAGDTVHLVSANLRCLLEPLIHVWGIAGVIATEAIERAGRFTGELEGAACHGSEKLRRTVARLGVDAVAGATAYGNENDVPLLRAVRTAFVVKRLHPAPAARYLRRIFNPGRVNLAIEKGPGATIEPFSPGPPGLAASSVRSAPQSVDR